MESISKIQLRLYAAKRKNGKWQLEMSRMPKRISVIGRTPIVDEHYMPSDLEVVSMSKLHKYVGSYYGKIVKTLKEEGIITKEYGMRIVRFYRYIHWEYGRGRCFPDSNDTMLCYICILVRRIFFGGIRHRPVGQETVRT